MPLTLDNWKSEYKRLQICFMQLSDPQSLEARGIIDHMEAVKQIIEDLMAEKKENSS